jgi:hypothetical protein
MYDNNDINLGIKLFNRRTNSSSAGRIYRALRIITELYQNKDTTYPILDIRIGNARIAKHLCIPKCGYGSII